MRFVLIFHSCWHKSFLLLSRASGEGTHAMLQRKVDEKAITPEQRIKLLASPAFMSRESRRLAAHHSRCKTEQQGHVRTGDIERLYLDYYKKTGGGRTSWWSYCPNLLWRCCCRGVAKPSETFVAEEGPERDEGGI